MEHICIFLSLSRCNLHFRDSGIGVKIHVVVFGNCEKLTPLIPGGQIFLFVGKFGLFIGYQFHFNFRLRQHFTLVTTLQVMKVKNKYND